jgi:site-specific DNA-methyltransferase (adenine-specific)
MSIFKVTIFGKDYEIKQDSDGKFIMPEELRQEGKGTGLKPGWEPIILARKPVEGTVAENILKWGTGGLNIDACRISGETPSVERRKNKAPGESIGSTGWITPARPESYNEQRPGEQLGRFPANLLLDCICNEVIETEEIRVEGRTIRTHNKIYGGGKGTNVGDDPGHKINNKVLIHTNPDCPCYMVDKQGYEMGVHNAGHERHGMRDITGETKGIFPAHGKGGHRFGDSGGASRFFYSSKSSRTERNQGTEGLYWKKADKSFIRIEVGEYEGLRDDCRARGNVHPTVKPIGLCRYLCRLIIPPGGIILDPFMGSGSTGVAAVQEGFKFEGIDNDPVSFEISKARMHFFEEKV